MNKEWVKLFTQSPDGYAKSVERETRVLLLSCVAKNLPEEFGILNLVCNSHTGLPWKR